MLINTKVRGLDDERCIELDFKRNELNCNYTTMNIVRYTQKIGCISNCEPTNATNIEAEVVALVKIV